MSKLDDLCAIKVMNWKQEWQGYQGYHGREPPIGIMWWKGDMHGLFASRYAYVNNTTDSLCQPVITTMFAKPWNPSTDLNDALVCLERAAQGKGYSIYMFPEEKKPYDVELEVFKVCTDAKTLPLAMCLCSLRAMGVPESEIQEGMK